MPGFYAGIITRWRVHFSLFFLRPLVSELGPRKIFGRGPANVGGLRICAYKSII